MSYHNFRVVYGNINSFILIANIDLKEDALDESCDKISKELQDQVTKGIQDVHYCGFYITPKLQNFEINLENRKFKIRL